MLFKRYTLVLVALGALIGLPLVVMFPSGAASAGLSAGFLGLVDTFPRMLLVVPTGVLACRLKGDERLVLPAIFLLLYLIGAMMRMDMVLYPMLRMFTLGAILIFGLALSVAESRLFLISAMLSASIAFHLGDYGMQDMPPVAAPLHYILGQLLAIVLVLATSFSIGSLVFSEINRRADGPAPLPDRR